MRRYTLVFSICAHAVVVAALIIVPALATDNLPEPQRTTAFIIVRPELPTPVAVRPQKDTAASVPIPIPVPLTPPEGVQPEPVREPVDLFDVALVAPLTGIPLGDAVPSGDLLPPPPVVPRPKDPVQVGGLIRPPQSWCMSHPSIRRSLWPPAKKGSSSSRRSSAKTGSFARCGCCDPSRCSRNPPSQRSGNGVSRHTPRRRTRPHRHDGHSGIQFELNGLQAPGSGLRNSEPSSARSPKPEARSRSLRPESGVRSPELQSPRRDLSCEHV